VINKGYWLKIGKKLPLENKLSEIPPFYTQDILNPDKYTIYEIKGKRPATKEECQGLEYYGVWEGEKMEERLSDHFTGKKNKMVENIKNAERHSNIKTAKKIRLHNNMNKEAV